MIMKISSLAHDVDDFSSVVGQLITKAIESLLAFLTIVLYG